MRYLKLDRIHKRDWIWFLLQARIMWLYSSFPRFEVFTRNNCIPKVEPVCNKTMDFLFVCIFKCWKIVNTVNVLTLAPFFLKNTFCVLQKRKKNIKSPPEHPILNSRHPWRSTFSSETKTSLPKSTFYVENIVLLH